MTCACKELEAQHGEGGCKCAHYRKRFPECQCEATSVSQYSPGPVSDDEVLVRTIFRPGHVDVNDHIKPVYFQDIVKEYELRGMSVNRKGHVTEAKLKTLFEDHPSNTHNFMRFIAARCADLRRLRADGGDRAFCIYDTATAKDCSHTDVCQSTEPPEVRRNRRTFRMKTAHALRSCFSATVAQTLDTALPPG